MAQKRQGGGGTELERETERERGGTKPSRGEGNESQRLLVRPPLWRVVAGVFGCTPSMHALACLHPPRLRPPLAAAALPPHLRTMEACRVSDVSTFIDYIHTRRRPVTNHIDCMNGCLCCCPMRLHLLKQRQKKVPSERNSGSQEEVWCWREMSGVDYRPLADQQAAAMYQQQNPYGQPGQQQEGQYAAPPGGYGQPPAYGGQQPMAYAPPQQYQPQQYQQQQQPQQQWQQQPGQYQALQQQPYASQPQQQVYTSPPAYAPPPQHSQVVYVQPPAGYAAPQIGYAAPVAVAAPGGKQGGKHQQQQQAMAGHPHGGLVDAPPRFEKAPHSCRDMIWSVLFLAHFIGICALAGVMWSVHCSSQ